MSVRFSKEKNYLKPVNLSKMFIILLTHLCEKNVKDFL